MASSTTRRYISINPQNRENSEELHLTNPRNQISGQISIINPATQKLENIANIFFSKEEGQQIAESIKESVKEELQGEYITSQDADSRFVSKEDAEDFALRSELEGLASEDQVQATVQAAMGEVENTYLKKEDAGQLATKEELQSAEQSIESSIQQTYLSIEDASRTYLSQTDAASLASKSEVASAKQEVLGQVDGTYAKKGEVGTAKSEVLEQVESIYARKEDVQKVVLSGIEDIDLESDYNLAKVAAKINEILAAFRSTGGSGNEGGQGGGNEPTVNPDPGEGSGTEGGEGTGGNDEPSSGDEPSQGETPSQSDPERDPAKTRVIYTEESGYPRTDKDIVGELTSSSIPYRTYAQIVYLGNTITSITSCAFGDNGTSANLTTIVIPNSVTNIDYRAFFRCVKLMDISIPSSVTNIGQDAFWACSSLTSISIPSSVTNIGENAFSYCYGLTSISIPDSVVNIGPDAFWKTNISTITILGKPTIGRNALQTTCHISTLNVPEFTIDEVQNSAVDWGLYVGCVANCKDGVLTLA